MAILPSRAVAWTLLCVVAGASPLHGLALTPVAPLAPAGDSALELTRVVLGFRGDLPPAAPPYAAALGATIAMRNDALGFLVIQSDARVSSRILDTAFHDPAVEYAHFDSWLRILRAPNDPHLSSQWALSAVGLPQAWDVTNGSHDVDIHVLDTGVDLLHPDLTPNLCSMGADFVSNPFGLGPGMESGFHGTHVAGIAAAAMDNGQGIAGASRSCATPVRVLAAEAGLMSWVAAGIAWSADAGAEVITMSLGGPSGAAVLRDAVRYAWRHGVVLVAATGNEGCDPGRSNVQYPAAYPEVVAVGALASPSVIAGYSNCGGEIDLAAPGSRILSTLPGGLYGELSGTSMATPLVAGIAGLLFAANESLSNANVTCILRGTAVDLGPPGHDARYGWGRVDAAEAVLASSDPEARGC